MKPVLPNYKLAKGDLIGIVAPARPTEDAVLERCVKGLENRGYQVYLASNVGKARGYLAGSCQERAQGFMETWEHPEVKAVWCYSGGYGSTRILDLLDYTKLRKNPKIFVGMSDVTALHAALQKKTGLATFLGPGLYSLYNMYDDTSYMEEMAWQVLCGDSSAVAYSYPNTFEEKNGAVKVLSSGKASGLSVGGNLSLICALLGTPYQIETEGKILFLEDVGEEPYRIDRMLCHLKHTGLLEKPAAVVLCTWNDCQSKKPDKSLSLEQVFEDYFADAPYPVLSGFPSGHVEHQAMLPLNQMFSIDADQRSLRWEQSASCVANTALS